MADPKRKKKSKKRRSAYKTRSLLLLLFSLPSIPNSHRWKMEEKKKQTNKREKRNRTNTHARPAIKVNVTCTQKNLPKKHLLEPRPGRGENDEEKSVVVGCCCCV
jgi:hypothetical protein